MCTARSYTEGSYNFVKDQQCAKFVTEFSSFRCEIHSDWTCAALWSKRFNDDCCRSAVLFVFFQNLAQSIHIAREEFLGVLGRFFRNTVRLEGLCIWNVQRIYQLITPAVICAANFYNVLFACVGTGNSDGHHVGFCTAGKASVHLYPWHTFVYFLCQFHLVWMEQAGNRTGFFYNLPYLLVYRLIIAAQESRTSCL